MVVAKAPFVAERIKAIGSTVAVLIGDASDFGLLGDEKRTVAVSHPEHLIQTAGVFTELWFGVLVKRTVDQIDITAPRGNGKLLLIRHDFETTGFDSQFLRQRNVDQLVVLGFFFTCAPVFAQWFLLWNDRDRGEG